MRRHKSEIKFVIKQEWELLELSDILSVSHIVSSQVTLLDDSLNSQLDVHSILKIKIDKHKTRILYNN